MDSIYDSKAKDTGAPWEWYNTEIGKGYQAAGVIRQPGSTSQTSNRMKVVDMSKPEKQGADHTIKHESDHRSSNKKHKSDKKEKKKKSKHKSDKKERSAVTVPFNPILQHFVTSISDSTRNF